MAIKIVCDGGCGATTDSPKAWKQFGVVKARQYCPECAPTFEAMMKDIDDLHDKTVASFQKGLEKIRSGVMKNMPKAEMPDA